MEKLTKSEAVRRHRQMWRWIADETEKRGECVDKIDAIRAIWPNLYLRPLNDCWCCEYGSMFGKQQCDKCPVIWSARHCVLSREYNGWSCAWRKNDYKDAAEYARQIAELPERE